MVQSVSEIKVELELIKRIKETKDDDAFTFLYKRYEAKLKKRAEIASNSYPMFTVNEFQSYFAQKFLKAVETFDPSQGVPFGSFLTIKLSKATYDYVKRKLYTRDRLEDGSHIRNPSTMVVEIVGEAGASNSGVKPTKETGDNSISHLGMQVADEQSDFGHHQEIEDTELYAYIASQNSTSAKVISLIAQGYSYWEVAKIIGRVGDSAALRMWTKRIVDKTRIYTEKFYKEVDKSAKAIVEG